MWEQVQYEFSFIFLICSQCLISGIFCAFEKGKKFVHETPCQVGLGVELATIETLVTNAQRVGLQEFPFDFHPQNYIILKVFHIWNWELVCTIFSVIPNNLSGKA